MRDQGVCKPTVKSHAPLQTELVLTVQRNATKQFDVSQTTTTFNTIWSLDRPELFTDFLNFLHNFESPISDQFNGDFFGLWDDDLLRSLGGEFLNLELGSFPTAAVESGESGSRERHQ